MTSAPKRILIVGVRCTGKTTLAKRLAREHAIPEAHITEYDCRMKTPPVTDSWIVTTEYEKDVLLPVKFAAELIYDMGVAGDRYVPTLRPGGDARASRDAR